MSWYESDPKFCENPLGLETCSSPNIKLLWMYSNLNIFAEICQSEGVCFEFFAPWSFLKFKVSVSELGSIFCVTQGDFNRSLRRLFSSQPESSAEVPWFAFRDYKAYSKREDYGIERFYTQADWVYKCCKGNGEKSQEAGSWNKINLSYVLVRLQRIKGWSLC